MARPIKKNAAYFPHENGMRHDSKINALRIKYGAEGYAFYCFFLETLTEAADFKIRLQSEIEWEILAADFMAQKEKVQGVMEYLVRLNLLQLEDGVLTCSQLRERLQPLVDQRKAKREWAERNKRNKTKTAPQKEEILSENEETTGIIISKILKAPRQVKDSWSVKYGIKEEEFIAIADRFANWWIGKKEGLSDGDIHLIAVNTGERAFQSKFASSFLANEQRRRKEKSSTPNSAKNGKPVADILGSRSEWNS